MVVVAYAAVSLDGIISKYNLTSLIIKYVLFVAKESEYVLLRREGLNIPTPILLGYDPNFA